ncbi:acetate/propionate family kinase [Roseibacterium sp. SDUM158017]|uniref:acetate/propionate family kinase n=1 Tax=Roseicyclus salinarum TaxID=3036773 RepID=UPI002414DC0C|nr:acetate/propionate family kinase [Roseibacterium sp. SDUM158017]MDG4648479.1 acetate/propionate family kinase [Roseibacterium sp. SDUM158017]
MSGLVLTLNAGSSSIKFGLYAPGPEPEERLRGQVDRLGPEARLVVTTGTGGAGGARAVDATDHAGGLRAILDALAPHLGPQPVAGVGHRVVHGGPDIATPRELTPALIEALEALSSLAPLHQPHNIAGIRAAVAAFPGARQVACFDTAFHRGHPWVNDTFALPRRFYDAGVRRYGFHGLSYDFITGRLERDFGPLARGRVIVAHLGNGASLCAIREGRSVGSTMGFSALDGMPMGTRCGQLDPGVILHMMGEGMDAEAITTLLYRESGLKGLSGLSHDMRTLLASDTKNASEAVDYYVFRLTREIGAMAAILGGVDALVFTGGIGENSPEIRARALARLGFLGLAVDADANAANAIEIHAGPVPVLVIPTDEERVIARATAAALA